MFERVKETVAERILVKSWLDDETRTQALLKLNSLRGRFHVWPGFYNDTLWAQEMAEVKSHFTSTHEKFVTLDKFINIGLYISL